MTRGQSMHRQPLRSFVGCDIGAAVYALPVEQVQEIVRPSEVMALPHAPPGVIGAVQLRGQVVPILDMGERLGYGMTQNPERKWILIRGRGRTVAVVVSRVHEVFEFPEEELRPAPEVGNAQARAASYVLNFRGKMAFVVEMEAIAKLADMSLPAESAS